MSGKFYSLRIYFALATVKQLAFLLFIYHVNDKLMTSVTVSIDVAFPLAMATKIVTAFSLNFPSFE